MALVTCPDCGTDVSTEAIVCPKCGRPGSNHPARGSKKGTYIIIGVVLAVVLAVVAVPSVGIIAAIAIPSFLAMQLRAKRSEAPVNLDAIKAAQSSTQAATGSYQALSACPAGVPGREPLEWSGTCAGEWANAIGWAPTGLVRCQYSAVLTGDPSGPSAGFEAYAVCDLDGDGNLCEYRASEIDAASMVTPNHVY